MIIHQLHNIYVIEIINIFLERPGAPSSHLKCMGILIVANFTNRNLPQQNKIHDSYQEAKR